MVGLRGGEGDWFWGESCIWIGVLTSGGGLRLTNFSISIRGMQGITESNSLNWLFGVS